MNRLIIAEKPSVALRIATALSGGNVKRLSGSDGVGYYLIESKEGKMYVVAAVGHLFTIRQSDGSHGYPVLNVEWAPTYQVNKLSDYTKKYLDTIMGIASECKSFVNACDFDVEGSVIGTNIISYIDKKAVDDGRAMRMKFSTTTTSDLLKSYSALQKLDINNFKAGEARHMLDWLWGINLSRALTASIYGKKIGRGNSLSIGRVQGPTLSILAKREREIMSFVKKPFWRVIAVVNSVELLNTRGDIFEREVAQKALSTTKEHSHNGSIKKVQSSEDTVYPYPPFDLTSLQLEASRILHLDPSRTLSLAQSLYERSYISYPRTSSQKLPLSLGLPEIIKQISKMPKYKELAQKLIDKSMFKPREGAKTDEAHPSIFPTGEIPSKLSAEEEKLYDLITRRFLSCFYDPAKVDRLKVVAAFGSEEYSARGSRVAYPGWLSAYPFVDIKERQFSGFNEGDKAVATKVEAQDLETKPKNRYTKAGLIAELEKRDLGTKATRAAIIDTLFKRNYITGTSIKVTQFGLSVYETLEKNCSMIVDEATTRRLEEDMELITKGKKDENVVIDEGKEMLLSALKALDSNMASISESLRKALSESTEKLGICPIDGGNLVIRRSRAGKFFAACSNYPKCTNTYSLPQNAKIEPTGKTCEHCHTPIIKVIRKGRRPFEMDLDPNCITKKAWASNKQEKETLYQCKVCGLHYKNKDDAAKCEEWCSHHQSCNLEITAKSVEVSERAASKAQKTKAEEKKPPKKEPTKKASPKGIKKTAKKKTGSGKSVSKSKKKDRWCMNVHSKKTTRG
ncbi:DNA topoisomerase III [mine drainage metagenome]|uniref:DNA topoisomerase n=1 Tax=mine drainage metagenome TaxID=410659 RepID=T0ZCB8_9ZZZZ